MEVSSQFHAPAVLPPRKSLLHPLNRRLDGHIQARRNLNIKSQLSHTVSTDWAVGRTLACVWKVLGLNLGLFNACPDWGYSCFSHSILMNIQMARLPSNTLCRGTWCRTADDISSCMHIDDDPPLCCPLKVSSTNKGRFRTIKHLK